MKPLGPFSATNSGEAQDQQHKNNPTALTAGRLLARNTIWNLLGFLAPMAVGVVAIPPLVRALGVSRFGVLSLAWIVIGYFSLFDLGIGRALTKLVADKLATNDLRSIPALVWTSLLLMLSLGVLGGIILAAVSPWLIHKALKVAPELEHEMLWAFYLLATSIPMVTLTSGLRGVLEAQQRFRILNLIRIPMTIFSFAGPLLALPFSHGLLPVISVLVIGRLIGTLAHLLACFRAMPALRHNFVIESSVVRPVVEFGGWMTISNIIGPMMVYLDRFLIGMLISVGMISYYTAPFDMVTRLWVIPNALVGVLFPAFTITLIHDTNRTSMLMARGTKYVFLAVFPIILVIVTLAPEGLHAWIGEVFAHQGSSVLRWLSAGVLVNSLIQGPFVLIQSAGRADITAKLHLAELPVYLVTVWFLTKHLGIEGTAIAWFARCAIDAILVAYLGALFLSEKSRFLWMLGVTAGVSLLVLYLATLPRSLLVRSEFLGISLLCLAVTAWYRMLTPSEKVVFSAFGKRQTAKLGSS